LLEIMPIDPYSECVRELFGNPRHAGDLAGDFPSQGIATAEKSVAGDHLTLAVGTEKQQIVAARFRVDGCPHLIAAAELVCRELENQGIGGLRDFDPLEIMRRLSVPPEKIGKILVLEDVLILLAQQIEQSTR